MLECKNLTKSYLNKIAVDRLSLQLEPGRIYALLGPNGSGKTTFMKMVAGLVKPTTGELLYDGQPIGIYSKSRIAYMPTESYFYTYMTGVDAGKYYHDFFPDFNPDRYRQLLDTMNLDPTQKIAKMKDRAKTFILSSHLVDELEKIIDHAIFIKDGVLVMEGAAEELRMERGKSIVDLYKEIYAE